MAKLQESGPSIAFMLGTSALLLAFLWYLWYVS